MSRSITWNFDGEKGVVATMCDDRFISFQLKYPNGRLVETEKKTCKTILGTFGGGGSCNNQTNNWNRPY